MSEWIKLTESAPRYLDRVLLCCQFGATKGEVAIGFRSHTNHNGENFEFENKRFEMFTVYAWMPLPEPPKE